MRFELYGGDDDSAGYAVGNNTAQPQAAGSDMDHPPSNGPGGFNAEPTSTFSVRIFELGGNCSSLRFMVGENLGDNLRSIIG